MAELLWKPSQDRILNANMTRFMRVAGAQTGRSFENYKQLYEWSVERIPDFWAALWEFGEMRASRPYTQVVDDLNKMPGAKWFLDARLNFAENLMRFRDDRTALIFKGEKSEPVSMTYAELYDQVGRMAASLREAGVGMGDRVVGFMPNMIETVVAMLAATSMGAIWSSCSPDFGIKGVLDRFGQIEPKIMFTSNGYSYNGRNMDSIERIAGIIQQLPTIEKVVVVPYTEADPDLSRLPNAVLYEDFLARESGLSVPFMQLPFDHPVYIMYSSGTTGVPKCIVHGAGGTLMQHIKELVLHTDLKREDSLFYFTTCGWMMWNWLVSGLVAGATLMLFDGSPFYPNPSGLWRLAQDQGISIFGTSARYLAALEKAGVLPGKEFDLTRLKAVLSTGSPLSVESFQYVYREIKEDLCLSSISGGTDLIGCFALGNPIGPVYAGELQCRGLGMDVHAYDDEGRSVLNRQGELVCRKPFPSMPIYFWNDPDTSKYKKAYFETYEGVWHHGDFIEITDTGGVVIYGRSDATLNPSGVRIGTAEIYRQVEGLEEITDSIVVGQEWEGDTRVILFVKTAEGVELTPDLEKKIKQTIRENTSPRHVPARIIPIRDIPYTISGKKVEMAVRDVIHGRPVKNKDALANPQALDLYEDLAQLKA